MTTSRTISPRGALAALVLPFLVAGLTAFVLDSCARASAIAGGCTGVYGWPVKPFDRAHPIRGGFGDPRTVFRGALSEETILDGDGTFSFHQGIDISAPDGTPVYAVSSGTVVRARGGRVTINCGNGRSFQYWHVDPVARVGERAVAGRTLLGFVQPKREHVHLTQLENGRAVNPLARGRLTPYEDRTVPSVGDVEIRREGHMAVFTAEATDMPSLAVPGRWHGFPITPALVSWQIEDSTGRVVVPRRVARDTRRVLPGNGSFWDTFARGTYQNWPVFEGRKARGMVGRYVFRLTKAPFDTHALPAGTYVLLVTAQDSAGNRASAGVRFSVSGV